MNILFIHQNFPGQYLHLARHMHSRGGHSITGIGDAVNIRRRGALEGITTLGYPTPEEADTKPHHYLHGTEASVRRGQAVARLLMRLRDKGFAPDVISVHPGWGEGLFVRDVYPETPLLMFCEFFFQANTADVGFDPEFPLSVDERFSTRLRNTAQLVSLPTADARICPTEWQASRYPACMRAGMHIIHDGINVEYMRPDSSASLIIQPLCSPGESRAVLPAESADAPGRPSALIPADSQAHVRGPARNSGQNPGREAPPLCFRRGDKVITYIARNLEPYRGFHVFLRALPEVQRLHPDAHVLIAGAEGVSYSPALPKGQSYKSKYLAELGGALDLSRIHFLGRVSYAVLRAMFCVSAANVYLTYPFVLSWSVLEAMACEGLIIASRTAPVEEVITHNENGLLVDFFDGEALARRIGEALADPCIHAPLRKKARETIRARYDLADSLRRQEALLQTLATGRAGAAAPSRIDTGTGSAGL